MKQVWVLVIVAMLGAGSVQAAAPQPPTVELVAWQQGESSADFSASHPSTSLTEVVDSYWKDLTSLGYSSTVTQMSRNSVTYLFRAGEGLLKATFTLYGNLVTATLAHGR